MGLSSVTIRRTSRPQSCRAATRRSRSRGRDDEPPSRTRSTTWPSHVAAGERSIVTYRAIRELRSRGPRHAGHGLVGDSNDRVERSTRWSSQGTIDSGPELPSRGCCTALPVQAIIQRSPPAREYLRSALYTLTDVCATAGKRYPNNQQSSAQITSMTMPTTEECTTMMI